MRRKPGHLMVQSLRRSFLSDLVFVVAAEIIFTGYLKDDRGGLLLFAIDGVQSGAHDEPEPHEHYGSH